MHHAHRPCAGAFHSTKPKRSGKLLVATILRVGKLRVMIYSNDHPPAHVHIVGPNGSARVRLGEADRLPLVLENEGLSRRQLTLALRAVLEHRHQLNEAWKRIHGQE